VNDFLPAIVALALLAVAFLLAWLFDLRRMQRPRGHQRRLVMRHSPIEWPNKSAASPTLRQQNRRR
jgi:cyanate permease